MHLHRYLTLIYLSLLVLNTFAGCPANNVINNFQSNYICFQNLFGSSSNQLFTSVYPYTPKIAFTSKPYAALAISSFDVLTGNLESFYTQIQFSQSSLINAKFTYKQGLWKSLTVRILVSAHPQIILGTFSANLNSLQGAKANAKMSFPSPIPNYSKCISRAFLNGYISNFIAKIDISLQAKNPTQNQFQVEITTGVGISIKTIYLSYLIFSPQTISFDSYGRTIQKANLNGQYYFNTHKNIGSLRYTIFGIVNLSWSMGKIAFESNIDQEFVFKQKSSCFIQKIDISYIILGISSKTACQNCYGKLEYKNQCLQVCPYDTYRFSYKNGGQSCKKCSQKLNFQMNQYKTGCSCMPNCNLVYGLCQPMYQTSPNPPITQTISGYLNANQDSCQYILNSYWNGYTCVCITGFKIEANTCVLINNGVYQNQQPNYSNNINMKPYPSPKIPVQQNSQPSYNRNIPQKNQYQNSQIEIVINPSQFNPFHPLLPFYTATPFNRRTHKLGKIHKKCDIAPWNGLQLKLFKPIICGKNQYLDQKSQKCICKYGLANFGYEKCRNCPGNSLYYNGNCIQCPKYSWPNFSRNICQCSVNFLTTIDKFGLKSCLCPCGFQVFQNRCLKLCPAKTSRNQDGQCAVTCKIDQILKGKVCVPIIQPPVQIKCPENQFIKNGVCVCQPGYKLQNGICVIDCGPNGKLLDYQNVQICICNQNYTKLFNQCIKDPKSCPQSQRYDYRLQKCVSCHSSCSRCLTNDFCVQCSTLGYKPYGDICISICGDGIKTKEQQCDDGNIFNNDGCDIFCKLQPNFINCNGTNPPCRKRNFNPAVCGNGVIDLEEPCDKGIQSMKLGCSQTCQVKQAYVCSIQINSCSKKFCGDGRLFFGDCQQCNDNNKLNNDGCSSKCLIQDGHMCLNSPSICTNKVMYCGNGIIQGVQSCDDNNVVPGDGCSPICQVQSGFSCKQNIKNFYPATADCKLNYLCNPICGDGLVKNGQLCDTGELTGLNGCTSTCQIVPGYICQSQPSICKKPGCGDGILQLSLSQQCDDSNNLNGDGCNSQCKIQFLTHTCQVTDLAAPTFCYLAVCGNGFIQPGQQCDDANKNSTDGCSQFCKLQYTHQCNGNPSICIKYQCGDGILSGQQQCDDGAKDDLDGCSSTCTIQLNYVCKGQPSVCTFVWNCGLFLIQQNLFGCNSPQTGNAVCDRNCQPKQGYYCLKKTVVTLPNPPPPPQFLCYSICGDGVFILGQQQCDDGNMNNNDGCSLSCHIEDGYNCTSVGNSKSVCQQVGIICGNSRIQGNQQCDDGNPNSGDGCSCYCKVEDGYSCIDKILADNITQKSICARIPPNCGNCIVNSYDGQQCDDGNKQESDFCSNACQKIQYFCGDGKVTGQQQCDSMNKDIGCVANLCKVYPGYVCHGQPSKCFKTNINDAKLLQFRAKQLAKHNTLRALHYDKSKKILQPLKQDPVLTQFAQAYAYQLIIQGNFDHSVIYNPTSGSSAPPLGQNLYLAFGPIGNINYIPGEASQSWYNQISKYQYKTNKQTQQVIQIIWAEVSKVGFGYAQFYDRTNKKVIVVAIYDKKPVNTKAQRVKNVYPKLNL